MKNIAQFLLVLVVGLLLITLPVVVGPGEAAQNENLARLQTNVDYERTFLTIAGTIFLMLPTYWVFILQHRSGASRLWRSLWTVTWMTFVVHLYWAIRVVMSFGLDGKPPASGTTVHIELSQLATIWKRITEQHDLVSHPYLDMLLFLWWTGDVLISCIPQINGLEQDQPVSFGYARRLDPAPQDGLDLVRQQRGALHVVLGIAMLLASIPQGHGLVRGLGYLFGISIVVASAIRIVRRPYYRESLTGLMFTTGFSYLNRLFVWYQLPTWMSIINLAALREVLRAKNLHGTEKLPVTNQAGLMADPAPFAAQDLYLRREDGCYNDLTAVTMGSNSETTDPSGDAMLHTHSRPFARFGRNVPLDYAKADLANLMNPSPRLVSEILMKRTEIIEAPTLNLLAAAWIQFQTHDWFNHGEPDLKCPHDIPLPPGDTWIDPATNTPKMLVRATRPDPTRPDRHPPDGYPRTFVNAESHWWDASQIYGSTPLAEQMLRTDPATGSFESDGRMHLQNGQLAFDPSDPNGMAMSGFVGNWWAGLSLLHDIFVKEHNAICNMLRRANPLWTDDRLFATAKIINGALMAKIHTVEWTPALLQHPALQIGMNANWWGLATEGVTRYLGRLGPTEAFGGIPNSGVDHDGTPFTLTEEFVAVYRLHPLIPDTITMRSISSDTTSEINTGRDAVGTEMALRKGILKNGRTDVWYTFGKQLPGQLTLNNYPDFLRNLSRESAGETDPKTGQRAVIRETIDLASVDILRDRERGVPRYNQFRRLFHMRPIKSFDELRSPEKLREVYGKTPGGSDDVELLDLMVGMFAETPPAGFAISDTAFRVFILMASRRLKSDRFIAEGFCEEVFTKEGVDWVNDNSMISIIIRHFPELAGPLNGVGNAFVPWRDVDKAK